MDEHERSVKRRKRPRRPGPPPASLVELLQKDRAVFKYFESLQAALDNDVQVWKDRTMAAESALEQERKRSSVARQKIPSRNRAKAKHDDEKRGEEKNPAVPQEKTTKNDRHAQLLSADEGEAIDDTLFDNLSLSSSSSSDGSVDQSQHATTMTSKIKLNSQLQPPSSSESSQVADLVAKSLAVFAEYEVFLSSAQMQQSDGIQKLPTTGMPDSKERTDEAIAMDLVTAIHKSDQAVETQARLFRAIVLFDSFHSRRVVVDRLIERLNPGQWKVWLLLWRNDVETASESLLLFLLSFLETHKSFKINRLLSAIRLPDEIACYCWTGSGSTWLEHHLKLSLGESSMEHVYEILYIAVGSLKSRIEAEGGTTSDNQNEDLSEETQGDLESLMQIEGLFDWAMPQRDAPAVDNTISFLRKTLNNQRTSKLAQLLFKIYLSAMERESICPSFSPANEYEWKISCHLQRFRFMSAVDRNEPISTFPMLEESWKSMEENSLKISKVLECASIIGDGREFLDQVQKLIDLQAEETILRSTVLPCLRSAQFVVFVRVINLEGRKDRLTSFVCQCMRENLVWVRGVTSFNDSKSPEYGMYAYDGRGRLVEATHRLESYVEGGATELDKIVATHWVPNNLKPFDRDAPTIERSVRMSPTERACALSHVSCWRGVQNSLSIDMSADGLSRWMKDRAHLMRRFKVSGFASGRALLPENDAMPPVPVCVILEDDAILLEGFSRKLADLLLDLPRDFHFCSLGYAKPKSAPIIPFKGMVGVPSMLWYLTGYCLSARGAEYLLNDLPVVGPVDSWIGLKIAHRNWDNSWGMKIGVGAHAQPDVLPKRKDFSEIMNFHAYCATKPLCSQRVRIDTTKTAGSVLAASSAGRNWRRRDTDVEYSGHLVL